MAESHTMKSLSLRAEPQVPLRRLPLERSAQVRGVQIEVREGGVADDLGTKGKIIEKMDLEGILNEHKMNVTWI